MTKNKAIVKFCVICVLVALGITLTFVSFRIPFTETRWVGSIGAIETRLGIDLRGGVLAIFDAEENEESGATGSWAQQMNATVRRLENSLNSRGFVEASVVRQGDSQIRVEVPGLQDASDLLQVIGEPAELEFRASRDGEPFITGRHISGVSIHQSPTFEWGVRVNFTNEGGIAFRNAVSQVMNDPANQHNQMFIMANGREISAPSVNDPNVGMDNTALISGGRGADGRPWTRNDAENLRTQIESGLFELRLTISESGTIPPTLGQGALTAGIIAFIVGLAFIFIFMFLLYGHAGLLSNLSMLVFSILFLLALGVTSMVQLTLPGIAGIILAMAMAVDANIIIFERIKDEFRLGKKMSVAVESGFKKSFWTIFDANITTIIAAVILYFLGTGPIQGFAITLLLGVVISMFCSLFVLRQFAKLYLYINPNNPKHLRLKQKTNLTETETPTIQVKKDRKLKGI
ncbi:MAG: protein translocase subunit SecD [Firmicutes bacterium]|nr:protein translocase subunit SecD [Bacillota bacterium]